jgi:hypothetical protein
LRTSLSTVIRMTEPADPKNLRMHLPLNITR